MIKNIHQAFAFESKRKLFQVLIVILLWAICYPLITTGLAAFPPFYFATLRCFLAGISLLIAAYLLNRPLIPNKSIWFALILAALTFTSLGFTGMFLAGDKVSPGLATVIANIQPLLAALLGYFFLTERITKKIGAALIIGFIGIIIISYSGLSEFSINSTPLGIGLVLLGAIGVAIGNIVLKLIADKADPLTAMAWILLLGAVPLAIAGIMLEDINAITWNLGSITNLIILSLLGTALAFYWWLVLLKTTNLNVLNSYTFLTPVFGLLIGILFYSERLLMTEWLGVLVIVFAIFFACLPDKAVSVSK